MRKLAAAFRATTYRVETGELRFDLRIGARHPGFDDFLRTLGAAAGKGWAIVTAVNPGARRGGDSSAEGENVARQAALVRRVRDLALRVLPACNLADRGDWPAEPALLLVGIGERQARELAAEFAQSACVCGKIGSAARLIWCSSAAADQGLAAESRAQGKHP